MISPYVYPGMKTLKGKSSSIKLNKLKVTPEIVLEVISKNCSLTIEQILSETRKREIVDARHYFFAVMRKQLGYTYVGVGEYFNRDHTTVIHGLRKFDDRCSVDSDYKDIYENILFDIWAKV